MKKVFSVLTVAVLAVSTVFAGFSGSASLGLGYDFDKGDYGFSNGQLVDFDYELASVPAEKQGEGDVYASIKGSLTVGISDGNDDDPVAPDKVPADGAFNVKASISEAKVAGKDWSVSILNSGKTLDLAKNAVDKEKYELPYGKAAGVTADIFGFGVGFGLEGNSKTEAIKTNGYFRTKAFTLAEGMTLQAGAQGSFEKGAAKTAGGSLKFAYDANDIKASVATDLGLDFAKKGDKLDVKVGADVAASFSYAPVSVDVYYKTNDYLSAKVVTDLKSFEVPVSITITGSDLVNKQDLDLAVAYTADPLTVKANAGYCVADKEWTTGASASYKFEKVGTVAGGFSLTGTDKLTEAKANVSLTNTTLINGATLKAEYAATNFVDEKYGALTTSCTIEF